jgi:hypothetical protein
MQARRAMMGAVRTVVRLIESLVGLALVCACLAGLYNVLSDNAEVARAAEIAACADQTGPCRAQLTLFVRTPIAQSFDFATTRKKNVHVRCAREWVLVGGYACAASDVDTGLFPVQSPAPSSRSSAPAPRSSGPRP